MTDTTTTIARPGLKSPIHVIQHQNPKEDEPDWTAQFREGVVREYSATGRVDDLGEYDQEMRLHLEFLRLGYEWGRKPLTGFIEWDATDDEGAEIGLWFGLERVGGIYTLVLTDYDGLMSLPKEAIVLLRYASITVPAEFE